MYLYGSTVKINADRIGDGAGNKINTIRPTSSTDTQSRFATASRALAREMLKRHLINHMSREAFSGRDEDEAEAESRPGGEEGWEGLRIWEFEGLEDEGWKKYNDEKRVSRDSIVHARAIELTEGTTFDIADVLYGHRCRAATDE